MTRGQRQSGLTLPEVLISVTILAAMAATIAPGIRAATRVTVDIEQAAIVREDSRISTGLLTRLAGSLIQADEEFAELKVSGGSRSLRFGAYDQSGDPVLLDLSSSKATGVTSRITNFLVDREILYEGEFLNNVSNIQFSYFGQLERETSPSWHQSWVSHRPPKLLRISGVMKARDIAKPFVLDVPFGGQAPVVCAFDPVSRLCRNGS